MTDPRVGVPKHKLVAWATKAKTIRLYLEIAERILREGT